MILIDRTKENTTFVLTPDGRVYQPKLFLKHDATRKTFEFDLPQAVETERCSLFTFATFSVEDLPDGYFNYELKEVSTSDIIEQGKLYIIPTNEPPIAAANTPGDYVIIIN